MAAEDREIADLLGAVELAEASSSDEEGAFMERVLSPDERKKRDCWRRYGYSFRKV